MNQSLNGDFGSLQQFCPSVGTMDDYGTNGLDVLNTQLIACLDIRTMNQDRHGANLLVTATRQLVPIVAVGVGLTYYVPMGVFSVKFGQENTALVSAYLDLLGYLTSAIFLSGILRPAINVGWSSAWWCMSCIVLHYLYTCFLYFFITKILKCYQIGKWLLRHNTTLSTHIFFFSILSR